MSEMTIDEATRDASVGGGELVPVSDAGTPKSMSVSQIKDYVLAQIAVLTAADGVSVNNDSVYILKGDALKPVSAATLAGAIFNEAFGRAAVAELNGNEVLAVKDSTERKTVTLDSIAEWLEDNIEVTPDLTLADAGNAGTLGDSDLALVVQAASGKKVTLATLKDYVLGRLAAYMAATTAAQSVSDTDIVLIAQGGVLRKATVSQLLGNASGGVTGPNTTTENKIPQWDSTTKKLKDGLTLTNEVNGNSTASQVPSAAAVHAAITGMGDVKAPATTTENKIPQWDSTAKKLKDGLTVTSSISSSSTATQIPTAAAVHSAINGLVGKSGTPTANRLAQWNNSSSLKDGPAVVTTVGESGADTAIPTERAVRTAITNAISTININTAATRYDEIFIPAAAMVPSATNGATAATTSFTTPKRDTMSFGTTNDDSCEFDLALPDGWNKGGLRAKLLWTAVDSSAVADTNVKWGIGCVTAPDGGSLASVPDNIAVVTDALSAASAMQRTGATASFTPEGTSGNGNLLHFTVKRINSNAPSSPLACAALLLGVEIQFARAYSSEAWS